MTTGSTLRDASAALRSAGYWPVAAAVLTVAELPSGRPDEPLDNPNRIAILFPPPLASGGGVVLPPSPCSLTGSTPKAAAIFDK